MSLDTPPPNTDVGELDGESPLSRRELQRLRKILLDADRTEWARRKLKGWGATARWLVPLAVSLFIAFWNVAKWLLEHLRWGSP